MTNKQKCRKKIYGGKYTLYSNGKVFSRKHKKFLRGYKTPQGYIQYNFLLDYAKTK